MEPFSKIEYGCLYINKKEYEWTDLRDVYGIDYLDRKMYGKLKKSIMSDCYNGSENKHKSYECMVEERNIVIEPSDEKGYALLEESQKTFIEKPSLEEMIEERNKRIGGVFMKKYIGPETYLEYYHNFFMFVNYCHEFFTSLRDVDDKILVDPALLNTRIAMEEEWKSNEHACNYYCPEEKVRVYIYVTDAGQIRLLFGV